MIVRIASSPRGVARRTSAGLVVAALGLTATVACTDSPASAGPARVQETTTATTSSVSVSDARIVSFQLPAAAVEEAFGGPVSSLLLEGELAPSGAIADLGTSRNGDTYTAMIGPMHPGLYRYRLRGDDTKVAADTTNPATVSSDPTWRTLLVPGPGTELLTDVPEGKGGAIGTLAYPGGTAKVWTPPGYDARRRAPYPVLFLRNGDGGGATDWIDLGRTGQILDNLSLQRRAEPMVVVMSDADGAELAALRRQVRATYRVAADPWHQAIAGISSGGTEALRTALTGRGGFGYVGAFSPEAPAEQPRLNAHAPRPRTELLRLYTGNVTDSAYNVTYKLLRTLDREHVRYQFDGVNPDAGHNWGAWRENLADFIPRLFHPVRDPGPSTGHLPLRTAFVPPKAGTTPTPWLTKDANGDTFATIETGTQFADAKHVTLWGNWAPTGSWVNIHMTRIGDRYRTTVGPLQPWFYYYKFIVDTVSYKDTANPAKITTEPTWSPFLATGERARLLTDVPAGQGGAVTTLSYDSKEAGERRSAYVWTPPGYDPDRATPYPVLYLQHGAGQHYTDWVEMGRAKQILDNLSREGRLVPMVVVMGEGNVGGFGDFGAFGRELLQNIVPAARATYNIASDPAHQALAGLSMGGFQTFDVLKSHPGEFAWIGTFSAAIGFPGAGPLDASGYDPEAINAGTKLLQIYSGNETDFVYGLTMQSMAAFDKVGIKYSYDGPTPGPHGWDTWQKHLIDFAPRLFRPDAG